jgi:selenium metabolism protein YedF
MAKTITVDALGEQCPIPVVKTKKVLEGLTEGGIVQTHVDNEIAVQNLTKLAKHNGLECSSEKVDEKHFVVTMKTDKGLEPEEAEPACIPDARGNLVVAIDTATMGRGNDELGKVLMKGFIYALSQLEELPKTILFYNGGATITTEGSDSLEDLKSMEAQGVTIKTCGTCLNYYNLTDKLQVGEVTNMYDIVQTLAEASKVIKP